MILSNFAFFLNSNDFSDEMLFVTHVAAIWGESPPRYGDGKATAMVGHDGGRREEEVAGRRLMQVTRKQVEVSSVAPA